MTAAQPASAETLRSARQHFAAPGGAHDRLIRRLATLLPAAIGLIAALMILTPLTPRGEVSFLLDRNKVAVAEDRLKVENAMYRGEDNEGRPFSIIAGRGDPAERAASRSCGCASSKRACSCRRARRC